MEKHQTVLRSAFIAGTTPRITCQIVDEDGVGFQPDTLTMSIYDVTVPESVRCTTFQQVLASSAVTQSIVNERNDVDVLADVDVDGNLEIVLEEADLEVDVPAALVPSRHFRRVLFRWTWDDDKVGKHEVILPIMPDRETVAT
jgi:hypothetical protein